MVVELVVGMGAVSGVYPSTVSRCLMKAAGGSALVRRSAGLSAVGQSTSCTSRFSARSRTLCRDVSMCRVREEGCTVSDMSLQQRLSSKMTTGLGAGEPRPFTSRERKTTFLAQVLADTYSASVVDVATPSCCLQHQDRGPLFQRT